MKIDNNILFRYEFESDIIINNTMLIIIIAITTICVIA